MSTCAVMLDEKVIARFWAKVEIGNSQDSCWLWRGATSGGRPVLVGIGAAHRISWILHFGEIEGDRIVKRVCENGLCVRPNHLNLLFRRRIGTEPIPAEKQCRRCEKVKPADEFPKKAQKVDGLESYCLLCRGDLQRDANLRRYGISSEQFEEKLRRQGGLCAACRQPSEKRLHVDHDHATGQVRALLCGSCNTSLGHAGDDLDRLRSLVEYLERWRS